MFKEVSIMDNESLPPELEEMLSKVRLKEPPKEAMADYLSGVNAKIDRGPVGTNFGFPQVGILLLVGLAFAFGIIYLFGLNPKKEPIQLIPQVQSERINPPAPELVTGQTAVVSQTPQPASGELSLEDQMALLETFGEETGSTTIEFFGNDELLDEVALLDSVEFSAFEGVQTSTAAV